MVNFQENIYVLTGPGGTGEINPAGSFGICLLTFPADIKSREQLLEDAGSANSSSPQSNFTKVTSKKSRGRRGKEEVGKPPPQPPTDPQNQKPLPRSRDYDRSKQEKDSSKLRGDTQEATESQAPLPEKEKFPRLEKSDFPALPGGGGEVKSLPGAWGARGWCKASDKSPDNTDNVIEVQPSPAACDEVSAVIVSSVPSSEEEGLLCEDSDNNNNPTCDEKVSVVTCPEEFEKKVANKDSPVVIFSEEEGQDWTSSEFTFGFDVNEELMATATSSTSTDKTTTHSTTDSTNAPIKVEEPRPEIFMPFHPVASIDSVDGAILEFGVAANNMRPLIVGVPVGVPVPASSFPLYSNHIVQPFPPFSGLTYPHLSGAEGATEDPAAISPESGISSSSPLSWQPESSPQLAATLSPLHSQVTESLSNWSGHLSEEETDQDSGLASCKTENRFNFVEIVNYVSATWSRVSEDNEVQVFSSRPGAV